MLPRMPKQPHRDIDRVVEAVPAVAEKDVAAHLAGERRVQLGELRLDRRMPGRQHDRLAAGAGDLGEQHIARLDVGEDRRAGVPLQHVARQHDHQLVAPQDAARGVDDADPVAIAVKGDAEVAAAPRHLLLQLHQVLGNRRVGMMRREMPVDRRVDQVMGAGEQRGQPGHDLAGRAVAGVPGDGERLAGVVIARQPGDVVVGDGVILDLPARAGRRAERERRLGRAPGSPRRRTACRRAPS